MAFVKRVTVVRGEKVDVVGSADQKKRKVARWAKPMERRVRRMLEAQERFFTVALDRHNRSNRKRRNGFMRDWSENLMFANRKAFKKLIRL